jgi:type I restriction enzyme M protein
MGRNTHEALPTFNTDVEAFNKAVDKAQAAWRKQKTGNGELKKAVDRLAQHAETSRDLVKQTDLLYKLATRLIESCENDCDARSSDAWNNRDMACPIEYCNVL